MKYKYGEFSKSGDEFYINTPDIERNWYNYLFNDNYITFTSQAGIGQGILQDRLGNRFMPVEERGAYIVSEDGGWNLAGLPVYDKDKKYKCTHGIGYTEIELEKNNILTIYGLFVPCEDSKKDGYEVYYIKVKNLGNKKITAKVITYSNNDFDGKYYYQGYNVRTLMHTGDINGMHYTVGSGDWNGEACNFEAFAVACGELSGYDCAKNAFIGPYNSFTDPIALHRGGCTDSDCIAEKMCYAVQSTLELAPGEEGFCSFVHGISQSVEKINELTERFNSEEKINNELALVKAKYAEKTGKLKISTPDKELDKLFNNWLKYQTVMGARWARVRHNGFRDIASDCECLAAFNAPLAWEGIKRLMTYQYSNGYAPRTVENGAIRDNFFSDNTVWLTFTVYYIVNEIGDLSLLDEEVLFNDGSCASVYEHLRRSVDFLYNFKGLHNLIKIWRGDWNDCMDRVGKGEKGVSIWLSIAWYRANKMFAELAEKRGDTEQVKLAKERGEIMAELVDKYGWDEEGYYIYAINDEGRKIGYHEEKEGKISLPPQIWAVFSGISKDGKEIQAMDSAEKYLSYDLGTALTHPAYTFYDRGIGSTTYKSPGVQENGGVYLHAMCWKLAADAMLGRADRVEWDMNRILPFRNEVVDGRAEPYTLCNSYMGKETRYRYGTPGQSWRTATAQWFQKAMLNFVFGLYPTLEGLTIKPCLPPTWDECSVVKPFRNTTYNITFKKTGNRKTYLDGKEYNNEILPLDKSEYIVVYEY